MESKTNGELPLLEDVPYVADPAAVFRRFASTPNSAFLDSGLRAERQGRFSFIGIWPFQVLKTRGLRGELLHVESGETEVLTGNPLDILRRVMAPFGSESRPGSIPLQGGAMGYISYDVGRYLEELPDATVDDLGLPELYFALYDVVLVVDHREKRSCVVSCGFPEMEPEARTARARSRLELVRAELAEYWIGGAPRCRDLPSPHGTIVSAFHPDEYRAAVAQSLEYIFAGDIFQVNISQRLETVLAVNPYELYCRLRRLNPADFAAYLSFDEVKVLSSSPERYLKLTGDHVETRPIKGTRPRGSTPGRDQALRRELLASEKDRAELSMIVDLERNDLGRVCRFGTVRVTEPLVLEEFATVHHLVSTVEGKLAPGNDRFDLIGATFPGGSITGAPKIRAMEIIEELEPTRRSIYTGSIGYLSFSGDMDLNIVIRTMLVQGDKVYFQVGGGIVADSTPEAEFQETLDKAKALIESVREEGGS